MDVHCLSASSLLHDKYRRILRDKGMLRPSANNGDILWQQMTLENFIKLLTVRSLYFKAYGEYTFYDEMRLNDFIKPHIEHWGKELDTNCLRNRYDIFERKLFISCWFNYPNLTDVSFRAYAKSSFGVAIGTTVRTLKAQISQAVDDYNRDHSNKIQKILCANIQYVPQNLLRTEELFEPAQVYAPIFTKGGQFCMDHEFRVCLEMKEPDTLAYNSTQNQGIQDKWLSQAMKQIKDADDNPIKAFSAAEEYLRKNNQTLVHLFDPTNCLLPVDIDKLIQYVAIKDDGVFHKFGAVGISDIFKEKLHISILPKQDKNGFIVFKYNVDQGDSI